MLSWKESNAKQGKFCLLVDGKEVPGSVGEAYPGKSAFISDAEIIQKILKLEVSEVGDAFRAVHLFGRGVWEWRNISFQGFCVSDFSFERRRSDGEIIFSLEMQFDFDSWIYPWPMVSHGESFVREFNDMALDDDIRITQVDEGILNGLELVAPILSVASSISESFDYLFELANKINDSVIAMMRVKSKAGELLRVFEFPEPVKVACEQYLLYFGKFLKDLGVEAATSVQEDAGRVLFSVTPAEQEEALEKIRLALEVFLKLPSAPAAISVVSSAQQEITVQQLTANIQHLQSQIMLANATLQQQALTIQQQNSMLRDAYANPAQPTLFSGDVVIESMRVDPDEKDTGEPLLRGLVMVNRGKLFNESVEIDLPKLLRILKQFLRNL